MIVTENSLFSRVLDVYEMNGRLNGIKLNEAEMGSLKYFLHQINEEKQKFRDLVVEHEKQLWECA